MTFLESIGILAIAGVACALVILTCEIAKTLLLATFGYLRLAEVRKRQGAPQAAHALLVIWSQVFNARDYVSGAIIVPWTISRPLTRTNRNG